MSTTDETAVTITFDDVRDVVVTTLGVADRAAELTPSTELLGGFSEFDSMAVLELVVALEERFGISVDDDDISAEVFETLGTLTEFVAEKAR